MKKKYLFFVLWTLSVAVFANTSPIKETGTTHTQPDGYFYDSTGCQAAFSYSVDNDLTVDFIDLSSPEISNWNWDFGDGTLESDPNPSHQYAQPGLYEVCLTIVSIDSCTDTYCETIMVGDSVINPPADCYAFFNWFPGSCGDHCIAFLDGSTPDANQWFWDFGDGTSSQAQNPDHDYTMSGVFNVCLTIETEDSCTETYCETIIVQDTITEPCNAYFISNQTTNLIVNFTDLSSPEIVNWGWDFGDGTFDSEPNPSHQYAQPGIYEVCLTIVSDDSCSDTYCETILVGDSLPTSSCEPFFTYSVLGNGLSVQFTDNSTGCGAVGMWNFGDGYTAIEANPVHTYEESGFYEVCLIFTDSSGFDTYCETIWVGDSIPPNECEAHFSWEAAYCGSNCVAFSDESMPDVSNWFWDFGDGLSSNEQNPEHNYAEQGYYDVCLTIEAGDSCVDTYCETIWAGDTLPPSNCEPHFIYYVQNDGLTVQFIDDSQGCNDIGMWFFGDGYMDATINPVHTYEESGTYEACLYYSRGDSTFDIYCEYITVNNIPQDSLYSVNGSVHAGNEMLTSGIVLLFNADYVYYSAYDYYLLEDGSFEFNEVAPGNYLLYAVPNPMQFPGYFPTYYVNAINWEDAYVLNVNGDTYDLDIQLAVMDSILSGNGTIGGYVTFEDYATYEQEIYGFDWFNGGKSQNGFAGMNIPIVLKNENGDALAYTLSDFTGYYEFNNLHYQGYSVNAEKASMLSVSPIIDINSSNHNVSDVDITIGTENIVTSVEDQHVVLKIEELKVYPNPAQDNLTVEYKLDGAQGIEISIVNVMGQTLHKEDITNNTGHNKIKLDVSFLNSGVYFIKIDANNSNSAFVKFIK